MSSIFISYRQDDTQAWAVLLRDRLSEVFGADEVFLDDDMLASGQWRKQIDAALEGSKVVLVVIGPRWLSVADGGRRRLWQTDDVHRAEIERALQRRGLTVIPVLVEGTSMPRADDLPPSIQALSGWQSQTLSSSDRRRKVDLEILAAEIGKATGLPPRLPATGPSWIAIAVRVLLITIGATIAFLVSAQVTVGWQFRPEEVSAIAFAILVASTVIAVGRSRARSRRHDAGR